MNRTITVSTDVYAKIWSNRNVGENDENSILSRILGCEISPKDQDFDSQSITTTGVYDVRNRVEFKEGFIIFRFYKGNRYSARANAGVWIRQDTGNKYETINQLNASIVSGVENVWNGNWRFTNSSGKELSINTLRK